MAQTLSIRKYSRETKKIITQHSGKFLFWDLKLQDKLLYKIYFLRVQYPNGKIEDIDYGQEVYKEEYSNGNSKWVSKNGYTGNFNGKSQNLINKLQSQGYYARTDIIAKFLTGKIDTLIMQKN